MLVYKNASVGYSDVGKGKTVVFLHGFLENRTMWDAFAEELSKKNRVISIDLLGHGETEAIGYVHSMEDNADLVYNVLSHLKIKKATIAGHSMGGYVALAFAEYYPEMVSGIALINSTSRADSDERKKNRDRAIKAVKMDYTSFVRLSVGNLFNESNRERLNPEIEHMKQQALKTPLQGIVASLEGMKIRKDREVILHFAPYPIWLFLGKNDPVLPYDDNADQANEASVKLITFPDGHMSPIENFEALLGHLSELVKSAV
ncbi:alpha/beta fold hydrolase [Flavobacterium silvaticum]|uniref:Alpha/beta hydrolase n=1 Tax=Flavobacterium silvaticum TaxID=1852020 RepID=A0A972FL35_9FLAO|nr:alpha/beta hydrolase [Flavobacterium silvaticum]NMH27647.1 alpha/beta hydrolase [Flavobacterium silvaticum]